MSLIALARAAPERPGRLGQLGLAVAATLAVGALAWLVVAVFAPPVPPPARVPFGIGPREALPSATGLGGVLLQWQSAFFGRLREALSALSADARAWPTLVGLGFAYGVFHAAGPGHGKAVISAYIVANDRTLRRGIALSFAAALVQASVAIALVTVLFRLIGGTAAAMTRTANTVEAAGFALVAGLGAWLVWRKAGKLLAAGRSGPAAPGCDGCDHGPPKPDAGWRELTAVTIGAGIRPCAGAIVVLTFAHVQGLFAAGIAATLAMALGTALTTSALAAGSVYAKRVALAVAGGRTRGSVIAGAALELAAAALLLVLGLSLLAGSGGGGA